MIHGIAAIVSSTDFSFRTSRNAIHIDFEQPFLTLSKLPSSWLLNTFALFDFNIPSISNTGFSLGLTMADIDLNAALSTFGISFPDSSPLKAELNSLGTHVSLDLQDTVSLTGGGIGDLFDASVNSIELMSRPNTVGVVGSVKMTLIPGTDPMELDFYGNI